MNSKLLYAATIAVSLISTFAMADEAPLTRAQVNAELSQAIANGTLQRTDYPAEGRDGSASSNRTRAQVKVEYASAVASRHPLNRSDANRTYNPFGADLRQASGVTRAEVKADVLQAAAAGTLQRTDYDDAALAARRAKAHAASGQFAQRVKAALARTES